MTDDDVDSEPNLPSKSDNAITEDSVETTEVSEGILSMNTSHHYVINYVINLRMLVT